MPIKYILAIIIFLVSGNNLAAQDINPILSTYFNKINPSPEFSSNMTNQMIEDEFGFIWVATQDGLNRFDGRRNQVYHNQSLDGKGINANDIKSLAEDRKLHRIWLGSSGGLNAIDTRTGKVVASFKRSMTYGKVKMPACNTIALAGNKIWLGSFDGLFCLNLSDSSLLYMDAEKGNEIPLANLVEITTIDNQGRLWVFKTNKGIEIYRLANSKLLGKFSLQELGLKSTPSYDRFGGFGFLGVDTLCTVAEGKLHAWYFQLPKSVQKVMLPEVNKSSNSLTSMYQTTDKEIWLYDETSVYKYETLQKRISLLSDANLTITNSQIQSIRAILKDSEGQWWFANKSGIAIAPSVFPSLFNYYSDVKKGVSLDRIYTLYYEHENCWVGSENGLYRIKNQTTAIETIEKGASFWLIDSFVQNTLLLSSSKGTKLFKDGKSKTLLSLHKELNPLKDEEFNSICYSGDSLVFFGSESGNGVFLWNRKFHTIRKLDRSSNGKSLPSTIINKVYSTQDGNIFIVSDEYFSIYHPANQRLDNYIIKLNRTNTPASVIMDVLEVDGKYWLACYGMGLFVLDKQLNIQKFISMANGLGNTGVYKLLPSGKNGLFVTSNKGLYHVNTKTNNVVAFTRVNGLQTDEYEEGAAYANGNIIMAGGINGFSAFDTTFRQQKFAIKKVTISGAEIQLPEKTITHGFIGDQPVTIPPNYNQVNIFISDYNFLQPAQSIIQYQISGIQTEWITLKNVDRVSLTGIEPGAYSLKARSGVDGRNWVEAAPINLVFEPKWYQTNWFKALLLITIASIFYGLYRYRLYQIQKENNIRTSIAADLHDDLGSTLTGIKVYSELGASTGSPEYYMPVKQGLQEASLALREMIWVLDTKTNTAASVFDRLEKNVQPLLTASGIELIIKKANGLENIICKTDEKRDLYLLLKEFINNSIKYAGCTNITLNVGLKAKRMQLEIKDNGKGFDVSATQQGNGLGNIKARAKRSGYIATFVSERGKGTKLLLSPMK